MGGAAQHLGMALFATVESWHPNPTQPVVSTSRSKATTQIVSLRSKKVTGEGACPYNGLYWHFIDRHNELLSQNPRMGLILGLA